MKFKQFMFAVAASFVLSTIAACAATNASLQSLADQAVSEDPAVASSAIATLRATGPAGLQALLNKYDAIIQRHGQPGPASTSLDQSFLWQRLKSAFDAVSAQHDCSASHLYWYTNFEQAKAAASAAGKPILSLRLLGRLDEEYSCANSRFFRTTLYADAEVARYLREHFILHWKSVRPVPRITIDFGDGRKIERTITGNSIHYILDADGRPIDALPGLYGPKAFLNGLATAETTALQSARLTGEEKSSFLVKYHNERLGVIRAEWRKDVTALGQIKSGGPQEGVKNISNTTSPTALTSAPRTYAKTRVELPMLSSFQDVDDSTWSRVAALHANEAVLDPAAIALIRSKNPTATDAGRIALTKAMTEQPLTAMLRNLERSLAEDTVRNEYLLHSQIHEWFINGAAPENVDQLNTMVYTKLFLTPDSDPWLGLVPANTFTGLNNNGLAKSPRAP